MKKTLFLVCTFLSIHYACVQPEQDTDIPVEPSTEILIHQLPEEDLEFLEIEGCEYIVFKDGMANRGFGYLAHKGNCKNSIHIYRDTANLETKKKDLQ